MPKKAPENKGMLELMTWSEMIENLKSEGNLKMAAIFDLDGNKMAETDGAMLGEDEAIIVLKALDTAATCNLIYGLFLVGSKFSCMNIDQNTMIGQTQGDIFVAYKNRNLLICAVAALSSKRSCLGTVKHFFGRLAAEGAPEGSVPSLM